MAVDYSGKSGAPCLLAIADTIRGGKSKVWVWQLGQATGKKPINDLDRTRIEGNTFTITKGNATRARHVYFAEEREARRRGPVQEHDRRSWERGWEGS